MLDFLPTSIGAKHVVLQKKFSPYGRRHRQNVATKPLL